MAQKLSEFIAKNFPKDNSPIIRLENLSVQ